MTTFDKVSMYNHIEIREKPNGNIIFTNIYNNDQLNAIATTSGKFGDYLLFEEGRKNYSIFRRKSELVDYVYEVWK